MVTFRLPAALPQKGTQFHTEQDGGWASEFVGTLRRREICGALTEARTKDRLARNLVAIEKSGTIWKVEVTV
jgi:hypothetical protein